MLVPLLRPHGHEWNFFILKHYKNTGKKYYFPWRRGRSGFHGKFHLYNNNFVDPFPKWPKWKPKHIWPTYDTLTNMDDQVKYYREVLLFRDKKDQVDC